MLLDVAKRVKLIVTLEENVLSGGFGEGVSEFLRKAEMPVRVLSMGVPDKFIEHGSIAQQMEACGLDAISVARRVQEALNGENV